MGWARLLFALLSQRFTGRVELDQGDARRCIVFRGGFAVWTDYEVPGTGLSEILASAGMLAADEAAQLLERAPSDSLDALTAAAAWVDAESAAMAMRDQCEQRLIATAGLAAELTLFDEPGLAADVLDPLEPARTLRVINFGVRGTCSPTQADEALAHLRDVDVSIGRAYAKYGDRFGFDSGERSTLQILEDRKVFRVDELLEISGLDAVRGMQLLYTLWSCNMLVEAGSEPEEELEPAGRGHSESSLVQELVVAKIDAQAPPYDVLALGTDATLADIETAVADLRRKVEGLVPDSALDDIGAAARAQRGMAARGVARKALTDRRWKRAVAALGDLAQLDPSDSTVALDLAWATWNETERRGDLEARTLDEAIGNCGDDDETVAARAHFYRGHLRKHQGRKDEALKAFERAASLDSRLLDAQREARALSGGSAKSDKPGKAAPSKKSKASVPPPKGKSKPRSRYWSGPWPAIWVLTGVLLTALGAAQIILRLNMEF